MTDGMTYEKAIDWLKLDIKMTQFDPMTGEYKEPNWEALQVIKAQEKAIEALEKQIPKKVGKMKETDYGSPYYCPECEAEIIPVEFFKADGGEPEEKVSYCWKCGRAIDWSE